MELLIEKAKKAIMTGNKRDARELLRQIIDKEPANDVAWELFADVAEKKDQAIYCLRQAVKHNPSNLNAQHKLSKLSDISSEKSGTVQNIPSIAASVEKTVTTTINSGNTHMPSSSEFTPSNALSANKNSSAPYIGQLRFIGFILVLLLAISSIQVAMQVIHSLVNYQKISEARELIEDQQSYISDLLSSYEDSAYDNSDVDRIAEQQLIAAEYTLRALQIIATQNNKIIELLAQWP